MDLKAKWIRTVTTVIVAVASFTGAAPGGAQETNVVRLTLDRTVDLALSSNFLDACLGWRRALLRIQQLTFYDFELDMPLLQRFGVMGGPGMDF